MRKWKSALPIGLVTFIGLAAMTKLVSADPPPLR